MLQQVLHGTCSLQNLAEVFDQMESYALKPGLNILVDITDADLLDTNYDYVASLEKRFEGFLERFMPIRQAIVAESDLEVGIAHMYEMLSEKDGFDVQVFRNRDDALTWLS